jgi:hypothetical protein
MLRLKLCSFSGFPPLWPTGTSIYLWDFSENVSLLVTSSLCCSTLSCCGYVFVWCCVSLLSPYRTIVYHLFQFITIEKKIVSHDDICKI